MATRTLTGPVVDVSGAGVDSYRLEVILLNPEVSDTKELIVPSSHDVTFQIEILNGDFTLNLHAPAKYNFIIRDPYDTVVISFSAEITDEVLEDIKLGELYLLKE